MAENPGVCIFPDRFVGSGPQASLMVPCGPTATGCAPTVEPPGSAARGGAQAVPSMRTIAARTKVRFSIDPPTRFPGFWNGESPNDKVLGAGWLHGQTCLRGS